MSDVILGEFSTDITPPEVTNPSPSAGAVNVLKNTVVEFDITDTETGVDTSSINVTIGGVDAIVAGVFQTPDFNGAITNMGGGTWHVSISVHPDFDSYVTIGVTVDGQDLAPVANVMTQYSWSFTSSDYEPPYVDVGYAPTSPPRVPVTALVEFDLKDDGYGVDLSTVTVTIGGTLALSGGIFQTGFDGLSSAITGDPNAYHIVIDASPDYDEWTDYEVKVNARDFRIRPEPIGPDAVFAWRMNEITGATERLDYAPNNKPLVALDDPLVSTDPGFGPFSNVHRPGLATEKNMETAWFDYGDVTWPGDKIWVSWWARPKNLTGWGGGTNQNLLKLYADVHSPPYISTEIWKDGAQFEFRFWTFPAGSTGLRNYRLDAAGADLDPTKWHLFGVWLDGATGDWGMYYNLDLVVSGSLGAPTTLGHDQPTASNMRWRSSQADLDIMELFVENKIYSPTEWANKYARYPG